LDFEELLKFLLGRKENNPKIQTQIGSITNINDLGGMIVVRHDDRLLSKVPKQLP